MDAGIKINFSRFTSEEEAPGITSRSTFVNGVRWAQVEYGPDVLREEWCFEGHVGFVLEGQMTFEFDDDAVAIVLGPGDAFGLADGRAHRGQAGASGARIFVIDRFPDL